MKKNCKKVCALLLAALLAATVFAGCKKNDTPEETPLDTTHEAEVTESGHWLVQGGRSGYTIVYPSAADDKEQTAVRELQYFFGEATGIMLPVIADDSVIWSETAEYLSVGQTSLLDAAASRPIMRRSARAATSWRPGAIRCSWRAATSAICTPCTNSCPGSSGTRRTPSTRSRWIQMSSTSGCSTCGSKRSPTSSTGCPRSAACCTPIRKVPDGLR